jgi:hypothetical protein
VFQSGEVVLVKFRGVWCSGVVVGHRRGWVECRITAPSAAVLGSIADRFPEQNALIAVT